MTVVRRSLSLHFSFFIIDQVIGNNFIIVKIALKVKKELHCHNKDSPKISLQHLLLHGNTITYSKLKNKYEIDMKLYLDKVNTIFRIN